MYSRSNSNDPRNRDTRIPPNYSGNAFAQRETPVRATPSKVISSRHTVEREVPRHRDDTTRVPFENIIEEIEYRNEEDRPTDGYSHNERCDGCERCDDCPISNDLTFDDDRRDHSDERRGEDSDKHCENKKESNKPFSLLSPIGDLGTEEILLIALALIIFQSGKEPELALILLALLFIN